MQGSPHRSPQHFHQHPRGSQYAQLRPQPAQSAQPSQATAAANKPKAYNPRHPERTLLYRTIAEHFETWLVLASAGQFDGQGDHHTPPAYVEKVFRKYLEMRHLCPRLCARALRRLRDDILVALSCKGRGVCPSCNTRRMAEAAAHLTDHVFPRLPVRQWVLSVPKRLRYYLQRDKGALNTALCIFLRVVQQSLLTHCPGAALADPASLHLGAVAFIHRFGSSLNTHVHFHVCVVDGVFEAVAGPIAQNVDTDAAAQAKPEPDPAPAPAPQSVIFHAATGLVESAIATVQANVRKRILRAFVARGHIEAYDAKDMAAYAHGGGFSVDAGVRIEAPDRAGLERLLRYCARPPFVMDRLKQRDADLVYRCGKGHTEPLQSDKYSGELVLTPLEVINRIAQLVPPPRTHRHRYYGVLAPNSPLRAAVTIMAKVAAPVVVNCPVADATHTDAGSASSASSVPGVSGVGAVLQPDPQAKPKPKPRPPSHYLWAALIARIYEVFPLLCPMCGGQMRIIAFTPLVQTFKRFWSTSASTHKPRASPRHAGHRCGKLKVRRIRGKVLRLSRTGIWQTNQHPITPTISAQTGEPEKGGATAAPG